MPRRAAWTLLRSPSPAPLRDVDRVAERFELELRDRAFLRKLVGTEVRRRASLRAIVHHFAKRRVKADLAAHLHLALVQLLFMDRVPDHAAVSETLGQVHATLSPHDVLDTRDFLQAVIDARQEGACGDPRRDIVGRELHFDVPVFADPSEHPLVWAEQALSMPAGLMKRWIKRHGAETARALAEAALSEPSLSVIVARGERAELQRELEEQDLHPSPGRHANVLLLPADETRAATEHAAFVEGRLSVQGESALRAAEAVQARAGEELLELCAAPGGKLAVLALAGAEVTACDVAPGRLVRTRANLERMQLTRCVRLLACDGAAALQPGREFDGVLVDAPCSNTGVLAQRPEARWRFGPKSRAALASLQARLLGEGAARVRPGGRLVWSTCSIEPSENAQLVRAFLGAHAGWVVEEELESLPATPPNADGADGPVDGGYFARLRRCE